MARRTKRLWTDEEKRTICFQTTAPGVSVAQVARRYAVNANLIFKWLRDPRFAPEAEAGSSSLGEGRCPPEDVGGPPGYEHFLEAIADPGHPDHDELTEWHDEPFDPSVPDTDMHQFEVLKLAKRWQPRKK